MLLKSDAVTNGGGGIDINVMEHGYQDMLSFPSKKKKKKKKKRGKCLAQQSSTKKLGFQNINFFRSIGDVKAVEVAVGV